MLKIHLININLDVVERGVLPITQYLIHFYDSEMISGTEDQKNIYYKKTFSQYSYHSGNFKAFRSCKPELWPKLKPEDENMYIYYKSYHIAIQ